ncbi:coenzyme PQQ synthesis protein D (PqqD) [Cricetibacter osteomyelitidis]|uniref:Coenzyme PQQ synthesis protein D (PqqD) n=1 Tax=Cricetibacter osteomyelitidis TaxID=1521931 RepID=A0A4R2T0G1_9PAST|nr:PqqD family protein [Cricetibacter osteomyelitidis]TCP94771.1 coenzyme PQQ synthesis protein D (PqqD) [Cricetibacter osteomyelitidis]
MYIITCTQASLRYRWESEVLLTNLQKHGSYNIIFLLYGKDRSMGPYLQEKYGISYYYFEDNRPQKHYLTSIRPYLWYQFLSQYPQMEKEVFFYIDTDIIFREMIAFDKIPVDAQNWYGANSPYVKASYLRSKHPLYLQGLQTILSVTDEELKWTENSPAGAQWLIAQPTAAFFNEMYVHCERVYDFLLTMERIPLLQKEERLEEHGKWLTDMWCMAWLAPKYGITVHTSSELDFSWPTHSAEQWERYKILHNAGVTSKNADAFNKAKWARIPPFFFNHDNVSSKLGSIYYVKAVQAVNIRPQDYDKVKILGTFITNQVKDTYIAIPLDEAKQKVPGYIELNDSSYLLWTLIQEKGSIQEIIEAYSQTFEIDKGQAKQDLFDFIAYLDTMKIIRFECGSNSD